MNQFISVTRLLSVAVAHVTRLGRASAIVGLSAFALSADSVFADHRADATGLLRGYERELNAGTTAAVEAMTGMGLSPAYARDLVRLLTSIESGLLRAEFPRTDPRVRSGGITPAEFARNVLRPLVSKA